MLPRYGRECIRSTQGTGTGRILIEIYDYKIKFLNTLIELHERALRALRALCALKKESEKIESEKIESEKRARLLAR